MIELCSVDELAIFGRFTARVFFNGQQITIIEELLLGFFILAGSCILNSS